MLQVHVSQASRSLWECKPELKTAAGDKNPYSHRLKPGSKTCTLLFCAETANLGHGLQTFLKQVTSRKATCHHSVLRLARKLSNRSLCVYCLIPGCLNYRNHQILLIPAGFYLMKEKFFSLSGINVSS